MAQQQASKLPTQKVMAGALAGSVTAVLGWVVKEFTHVEVPPEIAAAVTTIVMTTASYITPPSDRDHIELVEKTDATV